MITTEIAKNEIDKLVDMITSMDDFVEISPVVVDNAKNFIETLYKNSFYIEDEEDISVMTYGSITIDIYNKKNFISLEIGKKQIGWFSKFFYHEDKEKLYESNGIDCDFVSIPKELQDSLDFLMSL